MSQTRSVTYRHELNDNYCFPINANMWITPLLSQRNPRWSKFIFDVHDSLTLIWNTNYASRFWATVVWDHNLAIQVVGMHSEVRLLPRSNHNYAQKLIF